MIRSALAYVRQHHVGFIALFLVLGGTATAAATISPNSSLRPVTGKVVKNDSLTGRDIRDGSIKAGELNAKSIPATTFSVTVLQPTGAGPQLINNYGWGAVTKPGTGQYTLELPAGGADCNFVASPTFPDSPDEPVLIYPAEAAGDVITFTTARADGTPEDLGTAFGYLGFSVIASCPT